MHHSVKTPMRMHRGPWELSWGVVLRPKFVKEKERVSFLVGEIAPTDRPSDDEPTALSLGVRGELLNDALLRRA